MTHTEKIKVGVVGACGRGGSLAAHLRYMADASVQAVCDTNAAALPAAKERLGAAEAYTDYEEMLAQSDLHAVIVGTPMPLHVPQSILALERDLHVLSEVPAAVSLPQCRELVAACQRSHATYMMAENACYLKHVTLVTELVRQGLFGDVYYAEGEYLHELKGISEITRWRRQWQIGIDGITYGSHPLGPILWWLNGDRVARVSCEGSGHHYVDPRGEPYCQDTSVMLGKTQRGALIKVRCDMVSNRPGCCNNWVLQGTRGALDTDRCGRYGLEDMRVWLADVGPGEKWTTLAALADRYLPEHWGDVPEEAVQAGHGGSDYLVLRDFIEAVTDRRPNPIGVHEALDMTLPGLVSQESIQREGPAKAG
jgi:predicted dehydrogenase